MILLRRSVILLSILSCVALSQENKVLLIGDSWAQLQFVDGSHENVFSDNGYSQIEVLGLATTESGSESSDWVTPEKLNLIVAELNSNPDVKTVQLTLGGNDFLSAWTPAMTPMQELTLQQQVINNLQTIINTILLEDNDIEVIISLYDYPNFVDTIDGFTGALCLNKWQGLGEPTAFEINSANSRFEQAIVEMANHPKVFYISHLGLMQAYFGFPSDGILPGDLMPPGDLNLPSPEASMRVTAGITDCFHLGVQGHEYLVQNLFDGYFHQRFDTLFKAGFDGFSILQ